MNEKDNGKIKHVDLYSGIGGFSLACDWLGIETICFVEINEYCQKVIEKHWPGVPIVEDVRQMSGWVVGENDGICYNKVCKNTDLAKLLSLISQNTSRPKWLLGLLESAKIAGSKCPYLQALLKVVDDFAPENADMNLCEAATGPMQTKANGCGEQITLIGEEDTQRNAGQDIKRLKLVNGAGAFSPVITIPARNAESDQKQKGNYERTILKHGQNIQDCDSRLATELLYVENATAKCTRRSQTNTLILTAGVPCQPASVAGKRKGTEDNRWLWPETFRIVRELRPQICLFENVKGLLTLEDGLVFENLLLELEDIGYEVESYIIPACALSAPHRRDRVWIVANRTSKGLAERPQDDKWEERKYDNRREIRDNTGASVERPSSLNTPSDRCDSRGDNQRRGHVQDVAIREIEASQFAGDGRQFGVGERDSVASHASGNGSETRIPGQEQGQEGTTGILNNGLSEGNWWQENWYEVASRFCSLAHGLPDRLLRYGEIHEKVRDFNRKEKLQATGNSIVPQIAYQIIKSMTSPNFKEKR